MLLIASAAMLSAQNNTIERDYVPVIQKTALPPLAGMVISEWRAYRYDARTDQWSAVPFQIDELDSRGRWEKFSNDTTDVDDELVFMPKSLGDRAGASQWLLSETARRAPRIELEFVDPLATDRKGWLYLYRADGSEPPLPSLFSYAAGPDGMPAADTVMTPTFHLGRNHNGWMDYLTIGNNKVDLIDRFKLRLAGKMFFGPSYDINEDYVEAKTGDNVVFFIPGPVRALHIIKASFLLEKLKLPLMPKRSTFDYYYQYFPHSFKISAETDLDASLLAIFGVQLMRQSLDFSDQATGMRVYSPFNREGLLIDGRADQPVETVSGGVENNWVMVSGAQGTVLLIFEISPMKNSKRLFYLHDKAEGGSADGTMDTGDGRSYGDMGLMVKATGSALISDRLTVNYKGYFVDRPNLDAEFGEQIVRWDLNPLTMSVREQFYLPSASKKRRVMPDLFKLLPATPNPYNPRKQSSVHFPFHAAPGRYEMKLYDLIGREVASFPAFAAEDGHGEVLWDGVVEGGGPLTPGVYFLQLRSGLYLQTQRLIVH